MSAVQEPRRFEDFEVGMRIGSATRTVTETDIVFWAGIIGDWNPAHADVEHARTTPFGERIAHGNIAFNLSVSLTAQAEFARYRPEGFVRLVGWERVRFTRPVVIGDTLRAERELAEKQEGTPEGGVLVYDVRVINQRDEVVMAGRERMLVRRRDASQTTEGEGA